MTSPLRRKHPTIASRVNLAKKAKGHLAGRRSAIIVIVTCGALLLALLLAPGTLAAQQPEPQRFVPPVHAKPIGKAHQRQSAAVRSPVRRVTAMQELVAPQDNLPPASENQTSAWRGRKAVVQLQDLSSVQPPALQAPSSATPLVDSSNKQQWTLSDGAPPSFDPPPELNSTPNNQPNPLQDNTTPPDVHDLAPVTSASPYRQEAPAVGPPLYQQAPAPAESPSLIQRPGATPAPETGIGNLSSETPDKSVLVDSTDTQFSQEDAINQLRIEPKRIDHGQMRSQRTLPSRFRQQINQFGTVQEPMQEDQLGVQQNLGRGLKTCEEFRAELLDTPITDIVLDTAALKPAPEAQVIPEGITRTWTDCFGNELGQGTLVGLRRGYIVVKDQAGNEKMITKLRLSDADLAIVNEFWDLPYECSLGCYRFEGRGWLANTMTWNASGLCHKPLYFQNVQLERYGHSNGPILEPIRTTAHFFVRLVTVPYQMGIHPPNECVYALGYYRPGNCAPWLREPVPISLAGTANQALGIVALGAILP